MGDELFWKHYDTIYAGKDYDTEVATVLRLLGKARTLLEIGCGTGEHTLRFSRHFAAVCAIDPSMDAIGIAIMKDFGRTGRTVLQAERIEDLDIALRFDAAVALFNVVHYCQTPATLARFFEAVARHLAPGGPFVFDCWNCEAVLKDPPLLMETDGIRREPILDRAQHTCSVRLIVDLNGTQLTHWFFHKLWTIEELTESLAAAGFVNIAVAPWMRPALAATAEDWKIMFICEKGR